MKKFLAVIFSITFCLFIFCAHSQGSKLLRSIKNVRLPRARIEVPHIRLNPHGAAVGAAIRSAKIPQYNVIIPPLQNVSLKPNPAYLFISQLTPAAIDSVTQDNNRTYHFLSHGIAARQAYHAFCDSIDALRARFDSLFKKNDSLSDAEFAKIQAADSVFADYIIDRVNGSPAEMLTWSRLMCEVYPHTNRKVLLSKPHDFEEVTALRHKYFSGDTLTFRQIYSDIIRRMVKINNTYSTTNQLD